MKTIRRHRDAETQRAIELRALACEGTIKRDRARLLMPDKLNYIRREPLGDPGPRSRQAQFAAVSLVTGILVNVGWCCYGFLHDPDRPSERLNFLALLLGAFSLALGAPLAIAALCAKGRGARWLILPLLALFLNLAWIFVIVVGVFMLLREL